MQTHNSIFMKRLLTTTSILSLIIGANVQAQQDNGWFIKPSFGISTLSDQSGNATNAGQFDGDWDVKTSSGFNAGLGLGYQYNPNISVEVYWEYRTNDTDTTIASTGDVLEGNYASNMFFLNGYYHLTPNQKWQTYVGAGIGWTQEIDIDLEENGVERSYSGDGDIGFQLMVGADYEVSDNLLLNGEIRYGAMSSVEMTGEENATGTLTGFDYNPLTIGIGLKYKF